MNKTTHRKWTSIGVIIAMHFLFIGLLKAQVPAGYNIEERRVLNIDNGVEMVYYFARLGNSKTKVVSVIELINRNNTPVSVKGEYVYNDNKANTMSFGYGRGLNPRPIKIKAKKRVYLKRHYGYWISRGHIEAN